MMNKKDLLKMGSIALGFAIFTTGCGAKGGDVKEEVKEEPKQAVETSVEKEDDFKLEWSIKPELGIKKGTYYRAEERFRQGHLGILEVIKDGDKIVEVEFNEMTRPNYYHRYFQNVPKRMSEYNFDMGAKKGAAWIQSVLMVEDQMIKDQRLTGEFDVVSGASNSIFQSMLPLAEKVNEEIGKDSGEYYYSIAEDLGGGLTGTLKVVLDKDNKISSVRYDEIFADSKDEIEENSLKEFYRQSKYDSVEYEEPSRLGFNVQMDALNEKVVETQDLLDLEGLPSTDESGNYASSGFTIRNKSWDNYLDLANKLLAEMEKDNKFTRK